MSVTLKKQDMPPSGGYAPIKFKRAYPKSYFSGLTIFATYVAVTTGGLYLYFLNSDERQREDTEMRSSRYAILPLLVAEQDREMLRQIRKNRDYETELMKNVKGWEVGTLWGEPIYKSAPEDYVVPNPSDGEIYAHTSRYNWWKRHRILHMS